jgi:type II secretory pathway pseudopilin PulG
MREERIVIGDSRGNRRRASPLVRKLRVLLLTLIAAGCVAWSVDAVDDRTRVRQARLDISRIGHAARLFRADFGRCPAGVAELAAPPAGSPYLERVEDPWGRPYRLTCPARLDPGGVDVASLGASGNPGGEDNISSP